MTSEARLIANRRNAKLSTGPRTADGKARASKNALRHGLNSAPERSDHLADVLGLAGRIAGGAEANLAGQDAARAELDLIRIRRVKQCVLQAAVTRIETGGDPVQTLDADAVMARALIECADDLLKLDRYERRARSRRRRAFRAL